MQLGMFMMPYHHPSRDLHQALLEDVAQCVLADRLGFDELWIGEHYSAPAEPITSPFVFLANLIARTERIRLGTGVINLPQQHPAVVAAHASLLDHLSQGRMMFGISTGGLPSDFELFKNTDARLRTEMMEESIGMILSLWAEDGPIRLQGRFWDLRLEDWHLPEHGIGAIPKPFQRPHPPIAVSAVSPFSGSVRLAGRQGWDFITAQFAPRASVRSHWQAYEKGCAEAGRRPDPRAWRLARLIHVGKDDQEARRRFHQPDGPFWRFFDYITTIIQRSGMAPLLKEDPAIADEAVTPAYCLENFGIAGDPARVTDQLLRLREESGPFETVVMLAIEYEDRDAIETSMRLMAEEVMPAMRRALGR
jgi:alkanesulfonate monooxygenase SsuD/methylene tetrahydromethanopterin reductase-like flavin-dependent oxidoreductase (luciferase family)